MAIGCALGCGCEEWGGSLWEAGGTCRVYSGMKRMEKFRVEAKKWDTCCRHFKISVVRGW